MSALSRRSGRIAAVLISIAWSLASVAPAQAAGVGAVVDLSWGISRAEVDTEVALLREAHVRWVRVNASWSMLEPNAKGTLDANGLAALDYAVDSARAAGLEVLMPISDGVPYWASADPAKTTVSGARQWNRLYKPLRWQDYGDVVRSIVTRYSARGVHAYEIWNEPNHPHFWPSGVNAGEYVEMLKVGAAAVRAADPSAKVLMGGLSKSDYAYLEQMYAAGARGHFDVANVHPYTGSVDPTLCWKQAGSTRYAKDAFCALQEIRASMQANGDGDKPIWATEMGWSSTTAAYGVSEATQADFLTKAYGQLSSWPYVQQAFWYSMRNVFWSKDDPADFEANFGVVRTDFTRKPAFAALKAVGAASSPSPTPTPAPSPAPVPGPAPTVDTPPTVRLTSPTAGAEFVSSLSVLAAASDDRGIAKVEFLLDGRVIGSDSSAPYALTYKVPSKLAYGAHTLTARATDTAGQITTVAVSVKRVRTLSVTTSSLKPGSRTACRRLVTKRARAPKKCRQTRRSVERSSRPSSRVKTPNRTRTAT